MANPDLRLKDSPHRQVLGRRTKAELASMVCERDEKIEELEKKLEGANAMIALARMNGKIEGVTMYAHWKDGVQYVGTCGTRLADAVTKITGGES